MYIRTIEIYTLRLFTKYINKKFGAWYIFKNILFEKNLFRDMHNINTRIICIMYFDISRLLMNILIQCSYFKYLII